MEVNVDLESNYLDFRPLKNTNFQWVRIEARVWLHLPTRHQKLLVNAAVAIFRGQKIADSPIVYRGTEYLSDYTWSKGC